MSSQSDRYVIIPVDPDDAQGAVDNPEMRALRGAGYRLTQALPIEHRGMFRLAFIFEPPVPDDLKLPAPVEEPALPPEAPPAKRGALDDFADALTQVIWTGVAAAGVVMLAAAGAVLLSRVLHLQP